MSFRCSCELGSCTPWSVGYLERNMRACAQSKFTGCQKQWHHSGVDSQPSPSAVEGVWASFEGTNQGQLSRTAQVQFGACLLVLSDWNCTSLGWCENRESHKKPKRKRSAIINRDGFLLVLLLLEGNWLSLLIWKPVRSSLFTGLEQFNRWLQKKQKKKTHYRFKLVKFVPQTSRKRSWW